MGFMRKPILAQEEEVVDPAIGIREQCSMTHECNPLKTKLDICTERANAHPSHGEHCTEELFKFMHCVDHCVSFMLRKSNLITTFSSLNHVLRRQKSYLQY
jgi:ubiquinol-cytochrome c reductase subunit 6